MEQGSTLRKVTDESSEGLAQLMLMMLGRTSRSQSALLITPKIRLRTQE